MSAKKANKMSCRRKGKHQARHRTHAVKPASLANEKAKLPPLVVVVKPAVEKTETADTK